MNITKMPEEFESLHSVLQIDSQILGDYSVKAINARDLYGALGINQDYSNWVKYQVKRNKLQENVDFDRISPSGTFGEWGTPDRRIEYALTVATAKRIAVTTQNGAGDLVWRYFLFMERKAQEAIREELKAKNSRPQLPFGNSPKAKARKRLIEDWGETGDLLLAAGWSDGAVQGELLADAKALEMELNVEIFSDNLKLIADANDAEGNHSGAIYGKIIEKGGPSRRVSWFASRYSLKPKEVNKLFQRLGWQVRREDGSWQPVGLGKDYSNSHEQMNGKTVIDGWKEFLVTPHLEKEVSRLITT